MWISIFLINILVGTKILGITCGTLLYWGLMAISIPIMIGFAVATDFYLIRQHQRRVKALDYPWVAGDIKWTQKECFRFLIVSFATSLFAGTLGLGGGTLNSPMFLELGILPAVVPATCLFMNLIISSTAMAQLLALNTTPWSYIVWFFCVGFVGGTFSQLGVQFYLEKFRKQSLLVVILSLMLLGGLVALLYTTISAFVTHSAQFSMSSPCTH